MNRICPLQPTACAQVALALCLAVSTAQAEVYESRAVVQVHPGVIETSHPVDAEQAQLLAHNLLPHELELIAADQTLSQVVTKLDLASRWTTDADTARQRMREMIQTNIVKGTDLIEIKVRSGDAEEAQTICQAVTESCKQRREEEERERAVRALNALEDEVGSQERMVQEKRKRLIEIVEAAGLALRDIPDLNGVSDFAESVVRARALEEHRIEVQVRTLLRLESNERLAYAAGLDVPDNPVERSLALREEAERALHTLRDAGISPEHPAYQQQNVRVTELTVEALERADELLETLQLHLKEFKESHPENDAALKKRLREALDSLGPEWRHDYQAAEDILKTMKTAHSPKRIALKIPKNPVTVHQAATLPKKPVKE